MSDVGTHRLRDSMRCGRILHLFSLLLWGCISGPLCWADKPIQPKMLDIALPPQAMAEALTMLSTVYGASFAVKSEDIGELRARPISGRLSLAEALTQLFRDTPLTFSQFGNGFVIKNTGEQVDDTAQTIEELAVYGFRQSLKYARDIKRDSIDIIDVVTSTEFAQYPDLNLAESLQRIPGITITREAGEGRLVSLRGIAPDFTLVTLNGMPVLANNDSPMDSRGQKQRDRSFDFNIFSTDLFNQAKAIKSYSAEQSSGGIAGTIALQTARPFDQPGFHASSSYQVGTNEYTDSLDTRSSALVSNTWEHWGGLFSYSYSEREVQERGANTFRWRNISINDADLSALPLSVQTGLNNGEYIVPRGNRYSVWTKKQERLGLGGVIQYDDEFHKASLDLLYAELSADRNEYHLYPRGSQSTPIIPGETRILDAEVNNDNELVYARYETARAAVESRQQYVATDYQQIVVNAEHQLSEKMHLRWLLGSEQSEFDVPSSNKVYMQGISDVTVDYRQDRFFADIDYANSDLLNPSTWRMSEIDQESYYADTEFNAFEIAMTFAQTQQLSWQVGGNYVQFLNNAQSLFNDDLFKDEWSDYDASLPEGEHSDPGLVSNEVPEQFSRPFFDHPEQNWLVLDTNNILRYYGIDPYRLENSAQNITSPIEGDLLESSRSIYISSTLTGSAFSVKAALRYLDNTTKISFAGKNTNENSWRVALPSINFTWESQQNWIAKLGLSKNVARPQLSDLSSTPSFDVDTQTIYAENSELLPYRSTNVDFSLESYWSSSDLFSVSLFYKDISDYIVSQATTMRFGETDIAGYWQNSPFADDDIIALVKKQNSDAALVYGVETHLQHQFAYLPSPWDHVGVDIQASFMRGEVSYYDDTTGTKLFDKALPFLSEKSGALTLYYQSSKLSCRLSANYRSDYIYRVNSSVLSDEDETGFHATLYMDTQLTYQITPQWEFKFEAFNLSNQREEQYSDSSDRPYNTASNGRSFYLGLSFSY